ncbi:MAG: hypothetical protein AB1505_27975 [Candidatus Latescibacterota bacterium]
MLTDDEAISGGQRPAAASPVGPTPGATQLLFDVPAHAGRFHAATVPATLDLAERAALAVNGIGGTIDPELLTMWGLVHYAAHRPHLSHWASAEILVDPKLAESLTLMRVMSGSQQHLEVERRYRASILSRLEDGLYWDRYTPRRPWRNLYAASSYGPGRDEDFCTVPGAGRVLRTMLIWRELGGDEVPAKRLEDEARSLTAGLLRIAVQKDGYAYYPEKGGWGEPCAYPRSGWLNTDEAQRETEGGEGSVVCMHGHQIYGAARWYAVSRDPLAWELAEKLTRYVLLPRFWGGVPDPHGERGSVPGHIGAHRPDPPYTAGHEQGHWYSHFHARAIALRGILEWAAMAGDERAAEFVRRAYEFTLSQGMPRMGWINCYPAGIDFMEGCAQGDLVALGIRLSDLGLGDYWDDVDALARNQLVEQQLTRADLLQQVCEQATTQCCEGALPGQLAFPADICTRTLGVYAGLSLPTSLPNPWVMHCCTSNATQGLYYAWEGTLREGPAHASVNLFLNRAGRLLSVDSFLPYEGKVVLRAHEPCSLDIRIPAWVRRDEMRLAANGALRPPFWVGNRVLLSDLVSGDVVTLSFPVRSTTCTYTTNAHTPKEQVYTLTLRGSTLVDIAPRDASPSCYPLYLRDHLKGDVAPLTEAQRFVPDRVVRGW